MDENTKLIGVGVTGALLSILCCLTPVLVILLGALGLTAFVAKLDYVLVPVFVASLLLWPLRLCAGGGAAPRRPQSQVSMIADSIIACPHCGHQTTERMPQDACWFFYDCKGCGQRLRPKPGDCCVFCSYGSVPCPPIQAERSGETGAASCCAT
jgi:hypothetical protein